MKINYADLCLRLQASTDMGFLNELYASARQTEFAALAWPQAQLDVFLQQQFQLQYEQYSATYADALFYIVEYRGEAIGRFYMAKSANEMRLIDITLRPQYQNKGMGETLIKSVQDDARDEGIPVRLHVEQFNPALRLYKRLGFKICDEDDVHYFMEWWPV